MNEIRLNDQTLDLVTICAVRLNALNNTVQSALRPLALQDPFPGSPLAKDLAAAQREGAAGRMGLLESWLLLHTITRTNAIMDNLQGLRVLLDNVTDKENRTGSAPVVLARSVFDGGCAIAHHLDGTLEWRLLQTYASTMGDLQQALLAEPDQPDLANVYRQAHTRVHELGFRLNTDARKKTADLPRIISVTQGSRTANAEPNTTDAAKTHGLSPFGEKQWRYTSGITHGRIWALIGVQRDLEEGNHAGDPYLAACATAWHGANIAIQALSAFTGNKQPVADLDALNIDMFTALRGGGHVSADIFY